MPFPPGARLAVRPGRPLAGTLVAPGDKSITHRAYLLGLLAEGETAVENPNPGADCEATLTCIQALGAGVRRRGAEVIVSGRGGALVEPDRVLECGNSGTTLRLLAGVLAACPFLSVLSGDASLNRRPVARVIGPLREMGADLWARDGGRLPPLAIRGARLRAIACRLPVASAQVATSVVLAALSAEGRTEVTLPAGARDHTQRMLAAFGVPVTAEPGDPGAGRPARIGLSGPVRPVGTRVRVPGDFSAAAFFLAAAAAAPGACVTAEAVNLNPTRTGLLRVMERMGVPVERRRVREEGGEPVGDLTVRGPERLEACDIAEEEVPGLIDEVPAWVLLATAARGTSRIRGAAELRVKESDRLALLAESLGRLGVAVEESPDGLAITGGLVRGGAVRACDDHRIAMALALLGTRAAGTVTIEGGGGIGTSYPGFAGTLAALGGRVEDAAVPGEP